MKKFLFFIFINLAFSQTFPFFNESPWIIVENSTPFALTCQIETLCYAAEYKDKHVRVTTNNENNLNLTFTEYHDPAQGDYIIFNIFICCAPHQTTLINSHAIFNEKEEVFHPTIKTVAFTQEELQLQMICNPTKKSERYFVAEYQALQGILMAAQPISISIKCLSFFKHKLKNIILAMLHATDWLPY